MVDVIKSAKKTFSINSLAGSGNHFRDKRLTAFDGLNFDSFIRNLGGRIIFEGVLQWRLLFFAGVIAGRY